SAFRRLDRRGAFVGGRRGAGVGGGSRQAGRKRRRARCDRAAVVGRKTLAHPRRAFPFWRFPHRSARRAHPRPRPSIGSESEGLDLAAGKAGREFRPRPRTQFGTAPDRAERGARASGDLAPGGSALTCSWTATAIWIFPNMPESWTT